MMGKHSKEYEGYFWWAVIIGTVLAALYFSRKYGTSIWGN